MGTPEPRTLADLPEVVRQRVVALAADALPSVPQLPPSVRRVASFAPNRRARLGGRAIADALTDDEFRDRVGVQLAARPGPDPADPATAAARAWLIRPDGWVEQLEECVEDIDTGPLADERAAREVERLRSRLADAEQALRDVRAEHRARVEEYKTENATLRRRLGDSRAGEREARAAAEAAQRALEEERAQTEARSAGLEKENRRLRAQLEQARAEAAQGRRDARSDRDEATLRARMLLETVVDAAAGLRRELGLPAIPGSPGQRVEDELDADAALARDGSASMGPATAPMLEQLLSMPRARLIVDGYNVSKTAWPSSSLEQQRSRLVSGLAALVARTGAETTVVFDAADTDHRPPVTAPRGVRVVFSPRGVIADDVIRDLVAAEPQGRVVVVVTGDQAVARDVARAGARVAASETLLDLLRR